MKLFRSRYFVLAMFVLLLMPSVVKALVGILEIEAPRVREAARASTPLHRE